MQISAKHDSEGGTSEATTVLLLRFLATNLSGTSYGLAHLVTFPGDHLLCDEHFFSWYLNTQVSTSYHDAIACFQDLIESGAEGWSR